MQKARDDGTERFREVAAKVLGQRVAQVASLSKGILNVTDTEPAEAMWLATRRLRASLELFRPVLSKSQFPGARDEVKDLIRAVGTRRDVDASIRLFAEIAAEMDPDGQLALGKLEERLRGSQADANRNLARLTRGRRLEALRVRIEDLAGTSFDGEPPRGPQDYRSPEEIPPSAARVVAKRLDRLRSSVPRALEPGAVREQHRMRVAAERLRYSLELTAEALGTQADTARRAARGLQEVLGEIRDCDLAVPVAVEQLAIFEAEDVKVVAGRAKGSRDLDPILVQAAPNRAYYRAPRLATVHLKARRQMMFERFRRLWLEQSRQGVWVALETSLKT
jgi:CHAD domain-containing protein